jgi:Uma2 family endonuclease
MTAEEFLALPYDGVERWLIRGELHEDRDSEINRRNPDHSGVMATLAALLGTWIRSQPEPRGRGYISDVPFKLLADRDSLVGIDLAYISPELRAATPKGSSIVEGVPLLAVEILSPSDTHANIAGKVREYLAVGVPLVWIVDPDFETVTVYRADAEPAIFNKQQDLTADPHLPGFRVLVAELFE